MSLIISFFICSSAISATSQSGIAPDQFKKGHVSVGTEVTYFSTSANYTDHGTSLDFDSGYKFSPIQTLLFGRIDLSDQTSIFTELPLNYATSENPTDNYSSFKVSGFSFGVNQNVGLYSFTIVPELRGYLAFEKFDRGSDEILTSDGANYFETGFHFFKNISATQIHSYLGYQYRLDGFSCLLNYQGDFNYRMQSVALILGFKGFQTVTNDKHSDDLAYRHNYLQVVNGQSLLFGAVDPSRLDFFSLGKFTLSPYFDIYGGFSKSLRGENSADLISFNVGIQYFFGQQFPKSVRISKPNDNFTSEDEKIDPEIEAKIKNYNKTSTPKKLKTPVRRAPKLKPKSNGLEVSKKHLGKKATSTSPIRAKPKSKKPKRVKIEF